MNDQHPAAALAAAVADRLAAPEAVPAALTGRPWWRQSLAHGAPGIALLHIERAAAGLAPWQRARDWLAVIAAGPVTGGPDSHLFYGAPALAHALTCAATHRPDAYTGALAALDRAIAAATHRRLDAAHRRIDAAALANLAEFDLIRGLTGLGAHLLRRHPDGPTLRGVLEYLVRLSEPVTADGEVLPGWWSASGPSGRGDGQFPGGHANTGMAHGIAGPLALLALAARRGVRVNGHLAAITQICAWLERWRVEAATGPVWPYWVTRAQLRSGHRAAHDRQPPSWCYGTAGLARTQQLAALATGDVERRHQAEDALVHALSSPIQVNATKGPGLCHGYAGLVHIAVTATADAAPHTAARLRALVPGLLEAAWPSGARPEDSAAALLDGEGGPGLLDGAAGTALALHSALSPQPDSGWHTCLLTTAPA